MNPTMASITLRTRSHHTPTSRSADRAEDIGRAAGLKTTHEVTTDRYDRTITHHTVTLTGQTHQLHLVCMDLVTAGFRPRITT